MLKVYARKLGNVAFLTLEGQIVAGETTILRDALNWFSDINAIVLDLASVTTVDAHGLGVMLDLRQQSETNGISFELMNVSKPLTRVFEITRLDSVFHIIPRIEFFPLARVRRGPATDADGKVNSIRLWA